MANDLNQCNFIGRLGKDVETRFMPNGDPVANFSIAVGWKTKEKEGAEWVSVVAFGKLAEICDKYLKKGSKVFIGGRFRTRKWQDQSGSDRYSTEIIADNMQMLDGKPAEGQAPAQRQQPAQQQRDAQYAPPPPSSDLEDDIPFSPVSSLIY